MTAEIGGVRGREILDSRGRPTVEAVVWLTDGNVASASVPAGESKGRHEAVELRDGDPARYRALGVRKAAENISSVIAPALVGRNATEQSAIDACLVDLDGTPSKSRLGANALLAVSLAVARVAAKSLDIPLWRHLGGNVGRVLPLPMVNIISGGLHAAESTDFQDFLIVPLGAATYSQALEMSVDVYATTKDLLREQGLSTLKADEGGFGPSMSSEAALSLLLDAIRRAGYEPGTDIALAIDVAASHFYDGQGIYHLRSEDRSCRSRELVEVLAGLVDQYPIVSIEDGLSEDDWEGWEYLTARLGDRIQLLGDDVFATNLARLETAVERGVSNAILIKMNQIGTLTETITVVDRAKQVGFGTVVSARSGETEDPALADLAVATNAGQIKIGSVAQSERLSKYNQLLRIEEMLGPDGAFAGASALRRERVVHQTSS